MTPIIVSMICFFSLSSFAQSIESKVNTDKYLDKTFRQHFLFEYSILDFSIDHKETSSDSGFEEFGKTSDIKINQMALRYYLEVNLFAGLNLFASPALYMLHGAETQEDGSDSNNIDSDDRVSGFGGGADVGLSYSFLFNTTIIQPFISYSGGKYILWNFLRYDDDSNDDRSTEIAYKIQPRFDEINLGCKFVSTASNLTSYIALVYRNFSVINIQEGKATAGEDTEYALSSFAEAEFNNFSFKVGFGTAF